MNILHYKFTLPCTIKERNTKVNTYIICLIRVSAINRHIVMFTNSLIPTDIMEISLLYEMLSCLMAFRFLKDHWNECYFDEARSLQ